MKKSSTLNIILFFGISTLCSAIWLTAAESAKSDVSGTLELNGKKYVLSHVQAKTVENSFDHKKKDVLILLTDNAVSQNDFERRTLIGLAKSDKLHGLLVTVNEEQEATDMYIFPELMMTGGHVCEFEAQAFSFNNVAGRLYMKAAQENFGNKFFFDIQFQTPVNDLFVPMVDKDTGTPLAEGGGEVGKAYLEFDKQLRSGNFEAAKKFVTPDQAKQFDDPKLIEIFKSAKNPPSVKTKILEGYISGDRATLFIEGAYPLTDDKALATVQMIKINNSWLMQKQRWKASN